MDSDGLEDIPSMYTAGISREENYDDKEVKLLLRKAACLRAILEKDFKAADFKWSLFVAAAFTYRVDSCLRPFPSQFIYEGNKDINELQKVLSEVPSLDLVLLKIKKKKDLLSLHNIINILYYVLVHLREPTLRTVSNREFDEILSRVHSTLPSSKPNYIFEVISSDKSPTEIKWRNLAIHFKTLFAYHGSRLENFYSILHFGLQQHLSKNSAFGPGIYLSSELSVSLPYSKSGFGWGASCLGSNMSCVALCEVIDAPEGIHYQKNANSHGDGAPSEVVKKLQKGEVPYSYFVVTNNDILRVRYLLVYVSQPPFNIQPPTEVQANTLRNWLFRHKLFSLLIGYGLMLATIGVANNRPAQYFFRSVLKKLESLVGTT